jgi:hypothetical protein
VTFVFALIAAVVAIVALRRTRRIEELEAEIRELRTLILRQDRRPAPRPSLSPPEPVPPRQPVPPAPSEAAAPPQPAPPFRFDPPPLSSPVRGTQPPGGMDWERWIGIRGAAVLGAIALGLAGLLFFKYSIEHDLITPTMRVATGTLAGLGCLIGSEFLRRRGYKAAEAVAGAGVVILYAAFWAAHVVYQLIPMGLSFALMVLTTAVCCLLAVRDASFLVAVLGLVGGFATPLVLASGADRPIGLFGYVLLLDLGLLFVGRRRRWPSLGVLSLAGTALMQGLWIVARMGPDRLVLGLAILGLFSALFAIAGGAAFKTSGSDPTSTRVWLRSRIGALLFPFAFALYFAGRADLGPHLYPIAVLMAFLSAGASWVSRKEHAGGFAAGAAAASVIVVAAWTMQHTLSQGLAWELVAVSMGLALVFQVFVEWDPDDDEAAVAATIASGALFTVLLFASAPAAMAPWPWIAGWIGLTALMHRRNGHELRAWLPLASACGLALGLTVLHLAHSRESDFPDASFFLGMSVALAIAALAAALLRRDSRSRAIAGHAAAALPAILLVGLTGAPLTLALPAAPALGSALLLGALVLVAASRGGTGGWVAAGAFTTFVMQAAWTWARAGLLENPGQLQTALLIETLTVATMTFYPFVAAASFAADRLAWRVAALAGPFWFLPLRRLFEARFGEAFIGALPLLLGTLSLVAAERARRAFPGGAERRKDTLAWFAAMALCFLAAAIPLQLEKEWITIGWALQGTAVIALWRRLDHPGLKYFGLLLLGAASLRLVANPSLLDYHPRPATRIVNWLLYTYAVPAAALVWSALRLRRHELARARDWENDLYEMRVAYGAVGSAFAAIVVVFVWINLAIADWYAAGDTLRLTLSGPPAQRLSVSIAWILYALVLLGLGMARGALGLRWVSLCFLLVTIGKVFLYDLGSLQDLYRVASLAGLALSLLLVSVLYQRFVFRTGGMERSS